MNIIEIIKNAFVFPSKDMKTLLIYLILSIVATAFSVIGTVVYALGIVVPEYFMWGGIAVLISVLIGWVLSGYMISIIKSGIERDDNVPKFVWWDNFITGFNSFIVSIVYFIIPAFIVVVVGYITNIFGNLFIVGQEILSQTLNVYVMGSSTSIAMDAVSHAMADLIVSLALTATVGVVVFIIFSFLQTMAEARLANTGSLGEALNVAEAAKDMKRIGIGKVIAVVLLVFIIIGIIMMILSAIANYVPILSILSIIITPYMAFFAQRAVGLLYSDIA